MEMAQPPVHYAFDPSSQGILGGMRITHKSHELLNGVINQASAAVSQATEAGRAAASGGLNYDQFLQGLLLPDEALLLSGQYLYYNQVEFSYIQQEYGNPPAKPSMTKGRVFITNKRMLFLSNEEYQGLAVSNTGIIGEDKKPHGYHLKAQCSDVLHYQTIPLSKLKSLELHSASGVNTETNVIGVRPCWLLRILGACCGCCQGPSCLKSWYHDPPISHSVNLRQLVFGVLLPPWDHRGTVTIHLHQTFSMVIVKDFIAELQRYAPGLQCLPDNQINIQ
ncbi:uncharacterized protein [Amphiura filiformis]|uniref:uncharacterized protein isoform X2 n=1 Tax=Amphiura filiformis TaxID=82378 RepID=UPI003B228EBC